MPLLFFKSEKLLKEPPRPQRISVGKVKIPVKSSTMKRTWAKSPYGTWKVCKFEHLQFHYSWEKSKARREECKRFHFHSSGKVQWFLWNLRETPESQNYASDEKGRGGGCWWVKMTWGPYFCQLSSTYESKCIFRRNKSSIKTNWFSKLTLR